MRRLLAYGLLTILPLSASGQAIIQADNVTLQPQIGRDENGFSSCGVRAISTVATGKSGEMFDFSLVVYRGKYGALMKAGKYVLSSADLQRQTLPKAVTPAPIKFWIATNTDGKPLVAERITAANDAGFILGLGDLVSTWRMIFAVSHGEAIQFSLRLKSEPFDRVIAFSSRLTPVEMKSLDACMSSLYDDFTKDTSEN